MYMCRTTTHMMGKSYRQALGASHSALSMGTATLSKLSMYTSAYSCWHQLLEFIVITE